MPAEPCLRHDMIPPASSIGSSEVPELAAATCTQALMPRDRLGRCSTSGEVRCPASRERITPLTDSPSVRRKQSEGRLCSRCL